MTVDLVTEKAKQSDWLAGSTYSVDALDKGLTRLLGGTELQDGAKFHHATQNGTQFKTYELLISGNLYLMFSDWGWLRITETTESEAADKTG